MNICVNYWEPANTKLVCICKINAKYAIFHLILGTNLGIQQSPTLGRKASEKQTLKDQK